ncbi:MAG TPA: hypothetical protein VF044_11060, partial [Actinomycetota bacterium]
DGVGPAGGDCWASYPDFWGYWHGDGAGGWTWAGGGAASYRVGDGDVEGWSWGSGDAGDTHPRPPATRHAAVCEPLPAPSEPPGGGGDSGSTGGSGGSGGADDAGAAPGGAGGTPDVGPPDAAGGATAAPEDPGSGRAGGGVTRDERDRADADGDRGGGASTAPPVADDGTDDVIRATGASVPASDGPPAGLVAALVVGIALGVAGWRRLRAPAGRGGG